MGSTQQFCLKWNNHQSNMLSIFDQLLSSEHFVDVTLACDGLSVRAHKMVLSACSPFFQSLFIQNPCEHPIVILKDIRFVDLKALVQFMYRGEVNVSQDQLPTLLKAAEALKIKGLAEVTNESGSQKPGVPSVPPGSVGGPLGASLGGGHTHSHNGHLAKSEQAAQLAQQQPSVQAAAAVAAASPLAQSLAPAAAAAQNALVAAMQQTALKQAQAQLVQAAQAAQAAQERQNATSQSLSAASMASHESNSNASTPLRQTDSPMSQQNRKRRRKSAGSEKGSGDEGSGVESGAEDNLDETRGASDDESAGEEAEFEPSKLLEQSMTEVRQGAGHQDNNSSSSDNLTKDDIKPAINFDAATPGALASLNTQDPTAVLAFAAAAQAAQGASGGAGDSVAGPSQPTHDNSGDGGGACDEGPTQQLQQQLIALIPRKRRPKGTGPRALKNTGKSLYKCEQCDYTTSWPSWLRTHQRVHTGERPFACHLCSYTSSQSSNLQQHLKRHSDERPYKCDLCEYSCKRGHQLTTHRRTHFARDLRHLMSLHGVLPSSTSLTVNNFASLTQLNSSDGSEPPPSSLLDYGLPLSLIDVDLAASATRNLISSSSAPTASSVATPTFATAPDLTSRGATILTSTSSASPVSSATVTPASTTCTIAIGPPSPQLSFLAGGPSELTVTNAESQAPSRLPRYSDCIPWMASISSGSLLGMKSMPSMASPRVSDESAPFAEDTDQDPDQDQDQASQSRSDSDESDSESPGTLHIDEPTPADRSCDSIQAREHL